MKLSEFELDVMELFWKSDVDLSTSEIHALICQSKKVAHTTVKTILERLEEKGAIIRHSQKKGRSLLYSPQVTPEVISTSRIPEHVERFFAGNRTKLLAHLMLDLKLTNKELEELKELLTQMENSNS